MFVYVALDDKNNAVKVGITSSTVEKRLAGHNVSQDMFYFRPHYSKLFTKVTATECEKQLLKMLRKRYENVEKDVCGKTETFVVESCEVTNLINTAVSFIEYFTEEDAEEFIRMKTNYSRYVFDDFSKFVDMVVGMCILNCDKIFEYRVTEQTLMDLFHAGLATDYVYACRSNYNLLYNRPARKFLSVNFKWLPETIGLGEEHF